MSPEAWTELSSWGLLLWAIAAVVVLAIQLIAWPDDRQKRAATLTVLTTGAVLWRLWLSYRFGWSLGSTEQGIVFFLVAAVSWGWFAYTSWDMNRGRYLPRLRQIQERWRRR